ncbi:ribonuclease HII [Bacillus niameyensis]|uniref:ribonuclease HII n=1 Tax=Bacillus niameyensis TaxID=1522308 RepID=UPI000782AA7A|nr:ribonuclease HII [Bacillus niameyensis]
MKTLTIKEIKERLETITDEQDAFLKELEFDSRKGVYNLKENWYKRKQKELEEQERYNSMLKYESELTDQGFHFIAGIDEVGRGPLAGPVVSSAVILPANIYIKGLNDSKQLTSAKREYLYEIIMEKAVAVGIGIISAEEIDRLNIYEATKKSMLAAVSSLKTNPDFLLIDAMTLGSPYPEKSIIKGDSHSVSIAAASIVAKVTRDRMMKEYHKKYPEYGFNEHMGYGTKAHLNVINTLGPCPIHRKSFAPIRKA